MNFALTGSMTDLFLASSVRFAFGLFVQKSIAASMSNSPEPKKLFGTEVKVSRPQGVTPNGTKMGRAVISSNFCISTGFPIK